MLVGKRNQLLLDHCDSPLSNHVASVAVSGDGMAVALTRNCQFLNFKNLNTGEFQALLKILTGCLQVHEQLYRGYEQEAIALFAYALYGALDVEFLQHTMKLHMLRGSVGLSKQTDNSNQ